jgi:peptide/nickel transport system substrate-binding protein
MVAVVTACAMVATACGDGGSTAGSAGSGQPVASGAVGDQLTIALSAPPTTLDPAKARGQLNVFFDELAYEPLIVQASDGSFHPGLATSWHYVGTGNRDFTLELRPNVKFSDGTSLTAAGVVSYLNYLKANSGQESSLFASDTFTASGPLEVAIHASTPNPDFEYNLTQNLLGGDVISAAGLKNPAALGNQTFGAGPYQFAPAQSSSGSSYTFTPNPNYYDKSAVHWKKVVIQIIASPQSTLQALQTGQVDLALGVQSTLAAARKAGLTVTATQTVTSVVLADRAGSITKPLGDPQVRQALNYATDRASITNALFAGNKPTDQLSVPGGYAYDGSLDNAYPYDPDKAKQLLAAAGYPNGFAMNLLATDVGGFSLVAQALSQQWRKIGVDVTVSDVAGSTYIPQSLSGKSAAFIGNLVPQPIATEGSSQFLPAAQNNPERFADPTLLALYNSDVAETGAAKESLDRQIEAYLVHQAWFVPVVAQAVPFYAAKKITVAAISAQAGYVSLYDVQQAR